MRLHALLIVCLLAVGCSTTDGTSTITPAGPVRVKRAQVPGWPVSLSPEYEDVARIARERGMPIRLVQERIMTELHNAPE